ncbi:DNA-binding response regulator [Oxalobacteraceae bacterium CAVE-383]|nr:DNA-binding response regulator [Oxalobacteraceae bacterium CAVE-383]
MARILLLEEAADLRRAYSATLSGEGHRVVEADSVAQFAMQMHQTDIALIDIDLPHGAGFRAASCLQRTRPEARIMMLTARAGMDGQVQGLRSGADQYLIKPIRPDVLTAHVATMARRVADGGWRLDMSRRQLCAPDGRAHSLTAQEMILMELMFKHANRVVTRRMIAAAFDTDWLDFDERRLDQLVSRLRKRWRDGGGGELPLRTEHRQGYSFCTVTESE